MRQVYALMPFIKNVLILAPLNKIKDFENPGFDYFETISDEEINVVKKQDHSSHSYNNFHFRMELNKIDSIHDVYIMSDDDYRPIQNIEASYYSTNDKYNSFYFYDLKHWNRSEESYDQCLQNSFVLLQYLGYDTLAYSAHMPQIIDKKVYDEAMIKFKDFIYSYALCEWSMYFNYGHYHYPDKFNDPSPYETLCWPQLPGLWSEYVIPSKYSFENYYADNYSHKNSVFTNLEEVPTIEKLAPTNIEKLRRLRLISVRHSYPPPIPAWRETSILRKIKNGILITLFKLDKEIHMADRSKVLQILHDNKFNSKT